MNARREPECLLCGRLATVALYDNGLVKLCRECAETMYLPTTEKEATR